MNAPFTHRIALLTAPLALLLFAGQAKAGIITYQADYLVVSAQFCFTFCFPGTTGGTFSETFTLSSSQLATDGSYDVTSSLSPSFVVPGWTVSGYTADAMVAGGAVTDLAINYSATAESTIVVSFSTSGFNASGGSWSRSDSTVAPGLSSNSDASSGTYTIRQLPAATPEPVSGALALSGTTLLFLLRRKR